MLIFDLGLQRVRLELGVLYFKLGSYGQAKTYLTSATEQPDTPAEVRLRVQSFLTEIDRRQQVSHFSGFARLGLRHQSNANADPNGLNVLPTPPARPITISLRLSNGPSSGGLRAHGRPASLHDA
ncbi:MAG TPA: hypothetical protein VGN82_00385 [Bosea sp. (in: a-proteobacteria)]|uniref:hypothetical protein n=1 Tax=Bosea sp. (in: a-proteobacteria) TaxID=1871050 RepID=UPI002E151A93|nr:hypothetical protein [Bosea sp. (in: a-proteobacteria)]